MTLFSPFQVSGEPDYWQAPASHASVPMDRAEVVQWPPRTIGPLMDERQIHRSVLSSQLEHEIPSVPAAARLLELLIGDQYAEEDVPPTEEAVSAARAVAVAHFNATGATVRSFRIFPDYEGGLELNAFNSLLVRTIEIDGSGSLTARNTLRAADGYSDSYVVDSPFVAASFLAAV